MWHRVFGWEVSDFSMNFSASIFRVKQFKMTVDPEDEGTTVVQNFRSYLLSGTLSHPRRLDSSATALWEQILIWKISIGNYSHNNSHIPEDLNLQQHCCKNLKSRLVRLSLWLVSMYSLGNPEQNCENPVMTASNLADIPACCLLNFISRT
jgi:hypothetical protein